MTTKKRKASGKSNSTPKKKAAAKPKASAQKSKPKKSPAKAKPASKSKSSTSVAAKTASKPKAKPKPQAAAKPEKPAAEAKAAPKKTASKSRKTSKKLPVSAKTMSAARAAIQAAGRAVSTDSRPDSKTKPLTRKFLEDLGAAIKKAILPAIEQLKGREVVGQAQSGDMTFELDAIAEKALMQFLRAAKKPVAYYSEDNGYTTFTASQPTNLLIVDPIDGSRAARNGFEGCVISISSTRVIERPTFADLDNAYVLDIVSDKAFYADRGQGARYTVKGNTRKIKLSENEDLESMTWAMSVPARPAEITFPTAARLIDLSSLKGGFFACNSTSFSLTRLISNQMDAYVDFANRYYRDLGPAVQDYFINAGRGNVMGVCPYDFVGALLIAQEAGVIVTDAYGNNFDHILLLDSTVSNQRSIIAAANPQLYEKVFSYFDTRIEQFESLLQRRYES